MLLSKQLPAVSSEAVLLAFYESLKKPILKKASKTVLIVELLLHLRTLQNTLHF